MRVGWTQAAVTGSLVANGVLGWLLLSAPASPSSRSAPAATRPATEKHAEPEPPSASPTPAPRVSPPPSAQLGDATACSAALRDAQNRIVRYEKELPPTTRFEIADAHDDAQELRARPEIDRLLGKRAHTLECRGAICKVEIVDKSGANGDWAEALQTDPRLRRLVDGFQFHAGTPAQDPVTGEALMRNDVYLVMNDPDAALGVDVVTSVWNDLARSGFVRTCVDRNPAAKGALELAIALDPDAHRIAVTPGGTLPNTAVGSCLLGEVERAFAAVSVPAKVTSAHWYHSIALPDDAR